MAEIHKSFTDLIGKQPILELVQTEKKHGLQATLLGKLEFFNPAGASRTVSRRQ
jgi:cysteine synthase A